MGCLRRHWRIKFLLVRAGVTCLHPDHILIFLEYKTVFFSLYSLLRSGSEALSLLM